MNPGRSTFAGMKPTYVGAMVTFQNIQVRKENPLPVVGDRVVVLDEHSLVKFAGSVITVNQVARTYDVELRKSFIRVV